ncbi:hypothetical protein ADK57_05315 [Streptomyces sp. MMG1533]|uniref:SCO2400 family protein n=1 Tax=Streptomyces sp. MMG1533 TaxID=1415546 RepID=UPI0006AFC444|nr:hypothetical protein [Streptomyces sp. MMG1533]KOU76195.1 hypothetical protein ADK57_05315 [Streptomyces sp. MMG1533]
MDYCSSCRRHLNGALVCPGCGAYAPDIAPPAVGTRTGPARGADSPTTGDAPGITHADQFEAPGAAPTADVEGMPPARQGRAARRRQLARWKKNKRRAAVATAVALVGGGLTIATMDRHSTDRTQAATTPDDRSMGTTEQTPERTRPASTPPTTHRSSHTTPKAQPPAANGPWQQSLAAPPRTTAPSPRPDAADSPPPAATSAPQPQTTAPSSSDTAPDRTGEAAEQPSAPAASDGTNSGTPQTNPDEASTPLPEVCLLVVCLG